MWKVKCHFIKKKKSNGTFNSSYVKEKIHTGLKEELTLPGTKETIGTVLWTDISNRKLDTKLGADELLLSGELLAFCFYESPDGKIDWIGQTIPYEEEWSAMESMKRCIII